MNTKKLVLLTSLLAPVRASAEESQTSIEEPRRFELDVAGSYSAGIHEPNSRKPGLGLFLGYKLSPWSTLGLKFDTRSQGARGGHLDYEEYTLSYKRWLALGQWSPYLQVGAGYARKRFSQIHNAGFRTEKQLLVDRGEFAFQLGGGYRYSLTRDVGLDLGLHYHGAGSPFDFHDKHLVGKAGLNVQF